MNTGRWYERWLLLLLVLIYASSFIDRIIVAIVSPVLKAQMALSDFQVGLLSGFAFSIFYATLGIPIARLAERYSRVMLIAISVAAWSVMTMLSGTATGFGSLMAYRLGVGIGEAGSTPTAHSLISDQFPANRRATALGIYALGPPVGVVLGALGGGWIAQHFGWRSAFYFVGIPGMVLAALAYLTLSEPQRGQAEGLAATAHEAMPSLREVLAIFFREKAFWQMSSGVMTAAVALYGTLMFLPLYFSRVYGMSLPAHIGLSFAFVNGGGAIIGGLIGGYGSDWASRHDRRWYAWIPALGSLLAIPLTAAAFLTSDVYVGIPLLLLTTISLNVWNGPTFSIVHGLVKPRMRATASALVFLLMNLVGQGLGPTMVGFLSDRFAKYGFTGGDYHAMCVLPGATPVGSVLMSCHQAAAQGLRYALLVPIVMIAASVLLFYQASHNIKR